MTIYTKRNLARIAGEELCKDFSKNKNFHFTNTSYGGRGDVLGTIACNDRKNVSDHTIQYVFHSPKWGDEDRAYKLLRTTEDIFYKTNKREYSKQENEEIIKTVYEINDTLGIYTDDEEYSKKAVELRYSRYKNHETTKNEFDFFRDRTIQPYTKLYDKLFSLINQDKQIKYGTEITYHIYKRNGSDYSYFNGTYISYKTVELCKSVGFIYRKKMCFKQLPKCVYRAGEVKYE